jgi:DNA-binding transcriptional MerR regulator
MARPHHSPEGAEGNALDLEVGFKVYRARHEPHRLNPRGRGGPQRRHRPLLRAPGSAASPNQDAAGYRQYGAEAIERLRFVKGAQRVGLRLREIGELLAICDQGLCPCGHSEALLRARMAEIDAQVAELQAVRVELARQVERYPAAACHDPTATSKWCETAFAEERR